MNGAAGLIVARFLHYAALMLLFGAVLFPFYAYRAARPPAWLAAKLRHIAIAAAALALLSGVLWFAFATAQMSGDPAGVFDPRILTVVIGETQFGRVWIWRLAGLALVLALVLPRQQPAWLIITQLTVCAATVASLALVGHAATGEGAEEILRVAADALHVLAAGLWLGGLVPLTIGLAQGDRPALPELLLRFSGIASFAVAVLVLSGLVNSWFLVGTLERLVGTLYGQLLMGKLVLFAAMLCFAGANRFWLVPLIARGSDGHALIRLRRHAIAEQALGLLVLVTVASLGTVEPAFSAA